MQGSAKATQQINLQATRVRSVADNGAKAMAEAVQSVEAIQNSTQRMNEIIGVIDDLAFQTNILALNATVEAARAGDAGRGFAVVASEVRSLAQRSAESAKEIRQLIGASSELVTTGVGRSGPPVATSPKSSPASARWRTTSATSRSRVPSKAMP